MKNFGSRDTRSSDNVVKTDHDNSQKKEKKDSSEKHSNKDREKWRMKETKKNEIILSHFHIAAMQTSLHFNWLSLYKLYAVSQVINGLFSLLFTLLWNLQDHKNNPRSFSSTKTFK